MENLLAAGVPLMVDSDGASAKLFLDDNQMSALNVLTANRLTTPHFQHGTESSPV